MFTIPLRLESSGKFWLRRRSLTPGAAMLDNWRKQFNKKRFNRLIGGILQTPPIRMVNAPWTIVSMISNSDVPMYLLALKSFYYHLGRGKIAAIVDRGMPDESRAILSHHVPGITLSHLEDIDTGKCQRGGTWERVLHVLQRSEREYTLQLDADTLTFGDHMREVVRCVENNIAFTLGNAGLPIKQMPEWPASARKLETNHIAIAVERVFDRYPGASSLKYVRASSGFCGFAKGGFPRAKIEEFHENMAGLMGERWKEWSSEQVASNFAIANSPGAVVLPYPKYANFWPGVQKPNGFLHFIGTHRYDDDYFATQGNRVIEKLRRAHEPAVSPAQ